MSTIDRSSQINQLYHAQESAMQGLRGSAPNPDILLSELGTPSSIREYTRVGDGAHNSRHQQMLPPFVEQAWQRPQLLVRKVTVLGSHVLRYVSRGSNLTTRRQHRQSLQRARLARLDQHMNYGNASNPDQLDSDWLGQVYGTDLVDSRSVPSQSYSDHQMLQPHIEDRSTLSLFNWRIYMGVLCIIAAQALLKIAFDEIYHMS